MNGFASASLPSFFFCFVLLLTVKPMLEKNTVSCISPKEGGGEGLPSNSGVRSSDVMVHKTPLLKRKSARTSVLEGSCTPQMMSCQGVILCAGFGTRLTESIANDASQSFLHLLDVPKPLLPLGGSSIAERWLDIFSSFTTHVPIVVSNALYHEQYVRTFSTRQPRAPLIHNDGASTNDTRLGAVADIEIAINLVDADVYCVVAGDTLLANSVDVAALLKAFPADADALTVGYRMRNPAVECRSRGLLCVGDDGYVTRFVEKPAVPPAEPVLASAPLYFLRRSACKMLREFLQENRARKAPIATYDAPGYFMAHLCKAGARIKLEEIPARIDIGSLEDYIQALEQLRCTGTVERGDAEVVIGRCHPRVGCLGNPSDGYRGACVSFPISFVDEAVPVEARVFVRGSADSRITIIPNRDRDRLTYPGGWTELNRKIVDEGFYGGIRLIQAALIKFLHIVSSSKRQLPKDRGIVVGYASTIPFSVGLAGSSAIVTATMRALLQYYRFEASDFGSDAEWAQWIMEAETKHLKIAAGLQDRVAQWFARPMVMDFSGERPALKPVSSVVLAHLVATPMYVIWSTKSEESGVVHASLRSLWEKDEEVKQCMRRVAQLPALLSGEVPFTRAQLCDAMDENFNLRHKMLGPENVGVYNLEMVTLARQHGFAAKQAGSGGAVFCVPRADLSDKEVAAIRVSLRERGYVLCRVAPVISGTTHL